MRFDVLGPLRMHRDGEVLAVPGALRRSLLAILLARANQPVPAEVLTDALWQRDTDDITRRLHTQVHRLRGMFDEPDRLSLDPGGYRMRVRAGELDSERFDALVEDADDHGADDPRRAVELLREALGLWRGTPYQGTDVPELAGEVQRLTERRVAALEALYTAELRCGRQAAIVGELADVVRQHPLRERLHALLMTALYQSGRQADALAAYQHARKVLVSEVGVEPGPELRELERTILDGAPVEFAKPVAPRSVPAQLPHAAPGFVGRAAELSELDALLGQAGESVIAAMVGTAGVGKTSLVVWWARHVRDQFPDGQLYVDLRGFGPDQPASPGETLAGFLRALGVDGAAIPQEPAERLARFRTLVDGKRLLVVLDNAHSAEQVRPLLPGAATCRVVVTSRDSLAGLVAREGAHRVILGRMTVEEADRLLDQLLGDRVIDRDAASQLMERCARLPLALRIAAERLGGRAQHRIADLIAELADERTRLDLLDSGDQHTSVRAVFSSSYRHLDPAAARLFRLLGVHPGHDIDAIALAALAGEDLRTTRRLLEILVRAHLVDEVGDETAGSRYVLHDLLWTYATELAETVDSRTERRAALVRLFDHYLGNASRAANLVFPHELAPAPDTAGAPTLTDYDAAMRWLNVERVNLLRVAEVAPDWELPTYTTDLSTMLPFYLDIAGYLDEARHLHTKALAVAREHRDQVAEAAALRGLALMDFRRQRIPEAARTMEEALTLHEIAGTRTGQAITLNCLGVLYGFMGRTQDAVNHLQQAIDVYGEIDHSPLKLRALTSLGLLHRRRGQYQPALRCLHEAFTGAEKISHPVGQGHAAYGLAGLYRDTERYPDGLDFAHQAVHLARRGRFRFLEGLAQHRLGTIHMRLDDVATAHRHHREALAIARSIGNTQLEAMALNGTAEAHAAAGAPGKALQRYRDALAVADNRGADYEQARAHAGLGDVYEHLGEHDQAVEHWQKALARYHTLHAPESAQIEAKLARCP